MTNEEYYELIRPYSDARDIMMLRLNVMKRNLYGTNEARPIHNIQDRIKKKASIEHKLAFIGKDATFENAKDYLQDIAGIRVICYFTEDIYNLVKSLKQQSDLILITQKDYIKNPKPNGYRSYHVVVGLPVYYIDAMEYFPVEIQFRTLSMDFWASMEHRILYKKEKENREKIAEELKGYSEELKQIEASFGQYITRPDSDDKQ